MSKDLKMTCTKCGATISPPNFSCPNPDCDYVVPKRVRAIIVREANLSKDIEPKNIEQVANHKDICGHSDFEESCVWCWADRYKKLQKENKYLKHRLEFEPMCGDCLHVVNPNVCEECRDYSLFDLGEEQ